MKPPKILIPIPSYGFDPTEAAIPWQLLSELHYDIIFATPNGQKPKADMIMVTGKKLGIWKPLLAARNDAVTAYRQMENSVSFNRPIAYESIKEQDFTAVFLPGGHDKGVKEYLESAILQKIIVDFFRAEKPVAAVCHGVLLVARSIDPETGKSVLYSYKTTALLKSQELLAYYLTKWWLKDYYLTYPETTVEDQVKAHLKDVKQFLKGPLPLLRDSEYHLNRGFVVRDRNFLSARWPGDIYALSHAFIEILRK